MSLADLNLKFSYNNQNCDIIKDFLEPVLSEAIEYDRAVGFFSSSALMSASIGIKNLVKNGGKIKLVCSPRLSEEDINAIKLGYEKRKIIEESINNSFEEPQNEFEKERLNILSHLIADGIMDIKIAFMNSDSNQSMFHVKIGLIKDSNNNCVAFNGSMNDSVNAFYDNGETVDVYTDFGADYLRIAEKKEYFNNLWNNNATNVEVFDFPESTLEKIHNYRRKSMDLNVDEKEREARSIKKKVKIPKKPENVDMRDYQIEAYQNWKKNEFRGIYDMATGTGKTYTALYSICEILKEKNQCLAVVICCPYQHLVNQWAEDLEKFGFKYFMGFSHSKTKNWKKRLTKEVFNYSHKVSRGFCFITTNASFGTKFVQDTLNDIVGDILLVVDEAHNFGTARLVNMLDQKYTYRLALSATLERHNDLVGTERLYDFFGSKCIEYTLEMAIDAGMLCNYYYYPIPVYLEEDEYDEYNKLSEELRKYITKKPDGSIEYSKNAEMILIKRSRIVAGARMKLEKLREVATKFVGDNHLLVYCGATTVVDSDYEENKISSEETRQIDAVTQILDEVGIVSSKFTSNEDANTREMLKKEFDSGDVIKALVAIRCLDEGVNIPSIDKAIILASSTNPKEYIQRRGRVLRKYPNKLYATIYDFITLPRCLDDVCEEYGFGYDIGLIKRELDRLKDFSRLSLNEYESDKLINRIEDVYGYINEGEEYE